MRWEDERYVRVYTRDTTDWLAFSFEAQALLLMLLRKVDRAGILPLGKHGKRGVAIAIGHPREWERLESAFEELLADGCVRVSPDGTRLVIPNFIFAQEARASDKSRQQKSREFARDLAASESVTLSDGVSQNVTECHGTSHGVTPSHTPSPLAVPSCAVPSQETTLSADADPVGVSAAGLKQTALLDTPEVPRGPRPEDLQALWNRLAPPKGLQRWEAMGDDRKRLAKAALSACPDLAKWEAWLAYELSRPFNLGGDTGAWQANVDWLLRVKTRNQVRDFDPKVAASIGRDRPRLDPPSNPQPAVRSDKPKL